MKSYKLKLKGTNKNNTKDLDVIILGNNKSQAFSWAYNFFQKGRFVEPYFANGINEQCGGTLEFIPNANELKELKGKYFCPMSAIKLL